MIEEISEVDHSKLLAAYLTLEPNLDWQNNLDNNCLIGLNRYDQKMFFGSVENTAWAYCTKDYPWYIGSYFETILHQFKLKRIRFMWLKYNSCYEFHVDSFKNLHIPIITNTDCFFVFKSGLIKHLTHDKAYLVDTTLEHTVVNGGNSWRLHLVGNS